MHDEPMSNAEWADWCETNDDRTFSICGTRMKEHSRTDWGVKWCFQCRKRHQFWKVVLVPDGLSYYDPEVAVRCEVCKVYDTDLFPGWTRTWG
jgi:hypothetical protein